MKGSWMSSEGSLGLIRLLAGVGEDERKEVDDEDMWLRAYMRLIKDDGKESNRTMEAFMEVLLQF